MEENSKLESLEEMLNELDTGVSANSDTIKSTDNSDILEADVDVNIVKDSNITFREKVINKLKDYEDITNSQAKLEVEKEEVMNSIKKACPELFDRISKLDNEILAKDNQIDEIKKSITPLFEIAIKVSHFSILCTTQLTGGILILSPGCSTLEVLKLFAKYIVFFETPNL